MEKHLITDYKKPNYKTIHTELSFDINDEFTIVDGNLHIECDDNTEDLILDGGETLELLSLKVNNIVHNYELSNNTLIIKNLNKKFIVNVKVKIFPKTNTDLSGLFTSNNVFVTQCESHGFRRIIYSIDRPDVMSTYTVKIIGNYPVMLSNGNLIEKGENYVVFNDPFPKPSYLFALVAGDLGHISSKRNNVEIKIYAPYDKIKSLDFAMECVKLSMQWDEDTYGLYYDLNHFNIVALDNFNFGAMENKSLNIFNSKYIMATPQTSTDYDQELIMGVVGHEYFHNWTGNRVTLEKWFDLTLKEGLTVFRDQCFSMDYGTSSVIKRIIDVSDLRKHQFPEDSSNIAHPIRPTEYVEMDNFYTPTVYDKGAEVIRIYYTVLGKENFRKGMDLYFKRHDGHAVSCEDFWKAMSDSCQINIDSIFNWYKQVGTPILEINYNSTNDKFVMNCKQINGNYQPVMIPIKMALFNRNGNVIKDEFIINFETKEETYTFDINEEAIPSFMRGFSAPVILKCNMNDNDKIFLINNDTDLFNRWDLCQELYKKTIINLYNGNVQGTQTHLRGNEIDMTFLNVLRNIIIDENIDYMFKSQLITLPSIVEMIELIPECDPIKLYENVYLNFYNSLSKLVADYIVNKVNKFINETVPYKFEKYQIGKRELLGKYMFLLAILSKYDKQYNTSLIKNYYYKSDNLTDKANCITALSVVNDVDDVLEDFINNTKHDSLMIAKWCAFNANNHNKSVIQNLIKVYNGNIINKNTPNHIYRIFLTLASNPYFHSIEGYEFFEKAVLELDVENKSVASYIAKSFLIKNKLHPTYKKKIEECISRILSKDISNNLREILSA